MNKLDKYQYGLEVEWENKSTRDVYTHLFDNLDQSDTPVARESYNHSTRPHWKITTDATVSGGEIVSPILKGKRGIDQAVKVFTELHNYLENGDITRRCGYHVHISKRSGHWTSEEVKKIYLRFLQLEDKIDEFIPRSRRGNSSRWCQSNKRQSRFNRWIQGVDTTGVDEHYIGRATNTRYTKLNLQPLNRYGTMEFRMHGGTSDPTKISNWVRFLVGFIEASLEGGFNPATHRRQSNRAFGDIAEIIEQYGWTLSYEGRKWKWKKDSTELEYTTEEMLEMDDNRTATFDRTGKSAGQTHLNAKFSDTITQYQIVTTEPDTGIYFKQDQDVIDYLERRKGELV